MPVTVPRPDARLLRSPITWCVVGLVAAGICLALSGAHGLQAEVTVRTPGQPPRSYVNHPSEPTGPSVEEASWVGASTDVRMVWSGLLWVPPGGISEIGVGTAGAVRLSLNGTVVIERPAGPVVQEWWSKANLQPGPNRIMLEYERQNGRPNLQLRWKPLEPRAGRQQVPVSSFSPTDLSRSRAIARAWAMPALWVASLVWVIVLALMMARALARITGAPRETVDKRFQAALVFCALLFAAGMTWGWPGPGWAPDELEPGLVIDAWQHRFSGGWGDKYPPVPYYLHTVAYAPVLLAASFDRASTSAESVFAILTLSGRLLSVLLAVGTAYAIGVLTSRLGYRRDAWLAVLLAGAFLPMAFYAKTANVDAIYLFWFALSLVFFANTELAPALGDFVGLGVTAALAIASKDHAYSLYVLPGLYLLSRCIRTRGRTPRAAHLVATAVALLGVWTLAQNVVFNFEGFREHVRLIVGPASADFRMFANSLNGQAQLLRTMLWQIWHCLGWAGLVAVVLGIAASRKQHGLPPWLWLLMASSYVSFMVLVGYTYDRFLLPLTLVSAVPAAVGIGHLLAAEMHRAAGMLLLGWIVLRAIGLDVLMITDARYAAEAFLRREVAADAVIGSVGQRLYLPRLEGFFNRSVPPGIEATLAQPPDYIVINTEFMRRFDQDPVRTAWMGWLQAGHGPYRLVFRYKAPMPWYSPIRFDTRFTDGVEDLFSNLDKVNPEIAIFKRY